MAIVVLQTTAFGSHGGIQTYNRIFARALNELNNLGERYILIATDDPTAIPDDENFRNLKVEAFSEKRLSLILRVVLLVLTTRIDRLIIGHVNYAPLGLVARLLQPAIRYGVIIHGKDVWLKLSPWRRHGLQKADFILSVSNDTYEEAVRVSGPLGGRQYLLPNALEWEAENSQEREVAGLPSGILLLSVGRLAADEREKGVDTVIQVLPKLLTHVPDVQYVVIGSGTDLDRHRALAEAKGVSERVHFLGSVDDASLRYCYRTADIFVLPSAQEGFGIVFLEAMRYRKPVIAARKGGVPEVVINGTTGLLVEYGNEEQLCSALVRLCKDTKLRAQMGAAGYERLNSNFTYEHFKDRLTEIMIHEVGVDAARHSVNLPAASPESSP
jgi:phosphatidylinositol alpha-1,6-mannosyltransferase